MFEPRSEIHMQDPRRSDKRFLYGGAVTVTTGNEATVSFGELDLNLLPGQTVALFFERKRKFMQQAARVVEVEQTESDLIVDLELVGEAVSAEGREFYRVSTISAEITADVNEESDCVLVDVSAMGFAVIARNHYPLGFTVATTLRYAGEEHTGIVCVQSVRNLGRGLIRYGMRYLENEGTTDGLKKGLQQVSLAVEREMLRRRSWRR